jgi:EmrB/QacA subfamily drug resistance transporter
MVCQPMASNGPARSSKSQQIVLVAMTLANAIILVDQTAVPLALPSIEKEFGVGTQVAQWVLSASLLSLSGLLILGGRLGDLLGRRRMFVAGLVGFTVASAVGGLAPTFPLLLVARVVQGMGGALMLPGSVAIVNRTFPSADRGKALGTMGGAAAVAGALGPTIGGALTSAASWRLVLLVNVPLAVVCLVATLSAVPRDSRREGHVAVDLFGAGLLCLSIVALVFGLTETQSESLVSLLVLGPVGLAVLSGIGFVWWERRSADPLMDVGLLRGTPNYLGATISQALSGIVEMGLGLIFPLLLILNLGMSPFLAGLALIPTTVPIVALSTTVGRWYDRSGGRPPLVAGFGLLALSGLALGLGVHLLRPSAPNYFFLLPGLLVFGAGLAFVLTACDPVSLDSVDEDLAGQVSGVSATAEQAGGAIGIAGLYAIFHEVYVRRLQHLTHSGSSPGLTAQQGDQLRQALQASEQTGLQPHHFDPSLVRYLHPAFEASKLGYAAVFFSVVVVSALRGLSAWRLVRRPSPPARETSSA